MTAPSAEDPHVRLTVDAGHAAERAEFATGRFTTVAREDEVRVE